MKKASFVILLFACLGQLLQAGQIDKWVGELKSQSPLVRRAAALSLGNSGSEAVNAIRPLMVAAQIVDPWNQHDVRHARAEALRALPKIAPNDLRVFQLFIEELKTDPERPTREYTGPDDALAAMGSRGTSLIERALSRVSEEDNADVFRASVLLRYLALQGRPITCCIDTVDHILRNGDSGEDVIMALLKNGGAIEARRLIPLVVTKLESLIQDVPFHERDAASLFGESHHFVVGDEVGIKARIIKRVRFSMEFQCVRGFQEAQSTVRHRQSVY